MSYGDIGAVLDTLEFDTSKSANPHIAHVAGDIFAIVYQGVDNDGWLVTATINTSGNIGAAVVASLEFDTTLGATPKIVWVAGDVYCIIYSGPDSDGWAATVTITPDGAISAVIDTLEFDTGHSAWPDVVRLSSTVVAVVYRGPDGDGWLKTISMDASGGSLAVVDSFEFDATLCNNPKIVSVSGDIYAVLYSGPALALTLFTIDIDTSGNITTPVEDSWTRSTAPTATQIDLLKLGDTAESGYALLFTTGEGSTWSLNVETVRISAAGAIDVSGLQNYVYYTAS